MRCLLKKNVTLSKEQIMRMTNKEYYKLSERARNAVDAADKNRTKYAAQDTVQRNAEAAGIKDLTTDEFRKATKAIQPRMRLDRKKTAARAVAIDKREAKKTAAKRAAAAVGNAPAVKKAAPNLTGKTASFIAAQKAKEAAKKVAESRRKKDLEFKKEAAKKKGKK